MSAHYWASDGIPFSYAITLAKVCRPITGPVMAHHYHATILAKELSNNNGLTAIPHGLDSFKDETLFGGRKVEFFLVKFVYTEGNLALLSNEDKTFTIQGVNCRANIPTTLNSFKGIINHPEIQFLSEEELVDLLDDTDLFKASKSKPDSTTAALYMAAQVFSSPQPTSQPSLAETLWWFIPLSLDLSGATDVSSIDTSPPSVTFPILCVPVVDTQVTPLTTAPPSSSAVLLVEETTLPLILPAAGGEKRRRLPPSRRNVT